MESCHTNESYSVRILEVGAVVIDLRSLQMSCVGVDGGAAPEEMAESTRAEIVAVRSGCAEGAMHRFATRP